MHETRGWRTGAAMVLMLLCMLAWPGVQPATAQELVLFDESNPPFMHAGDNATALGLYPELVRRIFDRMQQPVTTQAIPWKRALEHLDLALAGVGGIYKNETRLRHYDFSEPLFVEELRIYIRAGEEIPYVDVDSLRGRTVGVMRGWSYGDRFDALRAAGVLRVEESGGDVYNLRKLLARRIDVCIAVRQSAEIAMERHGLGNGIQMAPTPFSSFTAHLAFHKRAAKGDLLRRFDEVLAAMHADGSFDALFQEVMVR